MNVATWRDTAHAGRWLTRALLVVGGAVAGTAVAWAVGNSTASADPITSADIAGHLAPGLSDLTSAAAPLGVHLDPAVDAARADEVRNTMRSVTRDAVLEPAERLLGSVERITRKPRELDLPHVIGGALVPPETILGFLGSSTGRLIEIPARPGTKPPTEQHERGPSSEQQFPESSAPESSAVPTAVALPASIEHGAFHPRTHAYGNVLRQPVPSSPLRELPTPAGFPLVPNTSASGGHADSPLFGVPVWALVVAPVNGSRAARFGARHLPAQPGTQPGVTPD